MLVVGVPVFPFIVRDHDCAGQLREIKLATKHLSGRGARSALCMEMYSNDLSSLRNVFGIEPCAGHA